jgi:hypothetical protein
MAEKGAQDVASSVTLEEFLDVASNSVLRAVATQRKPNEKFPWGPIIFGIIFQPPVDIGQFERPGTTKG